MKKTYKTPYIKTKTINFLLLYSPDMDLVDDLMEARCYPTCRTIDSCPGNEPTCYCTNGEGSVCAS